MGRIRRFCLVVLLVGVGVAGWNEPRHGIGWDIRGAAKRAVPQVGHVTDQVHSYVNQFGEASRALNR